jgi:hypothetical protein
MYADHFMSPPKTLAKGAAYERKITSTRTRRQRPSSASGKAVSLALLFTRTGGCILNRVACATFRLTVRVRRQLCSRGSCAVVDALGRRFVMGQLQQVSKFEAC